MQCDHDCFHCVFDDCIDDEITEQEMLDADNHEHEQKRVGRYDHQKYIANRDAILEKRKKHYQEIKDTVRARYLEKNKEKIRAYKHEYYLAHKEKWRKHA